MTLRWLLGIAAGLFVAGWLALVLLADSFRRSFGASGVAAVQAIAPVVLALLILIGLLNPSHRILLHLTAVFAVGLMLGCLWLLREAPFVASSGLIYLALWLVFYRGALTGR